MINSILDEIIKGLQERSSDIFYDFHESGDVDRNDNPVDPADDNAPPGRYQVAIEHLCEAAERAEAILRALKARPDLASRLFTETNLSTESLKNPLPLQGDFEYTPEPWTVEPHPDTEGAYIIKEALHEQQTWGPEGYDISAQEGDHRDILVKRRDAGNVRLIRLAPILFKAINNLQFFVDEETTRLLASLKKETDIINEKLRTIGSEKPFENRRKRQWHG